MTQREREIEMHIMRVCILYVYTSISIYILYTFFILTCVFNHLSDYYYLFYSTKLFLEMNYRRESNKT